jgi:hypothetical protein
VVEKKAELWMILHPEYQESQLREPPPTCEELGCKYYKHCSGELLAEFTLPSVAPACFGFLWPKDKDIRL